jgi:hypothetical protein
MDRFRQPAWVDHRAGAVDRPWTKVHLDFHNTAHVGGVGTGFDAADFTAALQRARLDAIVVFAKDMHGWCYYPARRADAVHPGLERDLLGEQVAACRAAGVRVHAYYCVTWDHRMAEQHPDWLVVRRDRTTYLPRFDQTPGWTALCLRNPAFVQTSLDDAEDVLIRYPIDGIWFDMPFPIDGECFCHLCLSALRDQGLDPLDVGVQRADKQALWVDWQRRCAELVQRVRPGCEIDQNNNTRLGLQERVGYLSNVDIEALPTGGWGYHYYPVVARYARTFGVPTTGMTARFARSWADVGGLKQTAQLRTEVAQIVAQGAQVCIGDQPPPSGRLDPAVYATIGDAYAWVRRSAPWLDGGGPLVEAALVASGELLADPGRTADTLGGESTVAWSTALVGAADLLQRHRVQFDVVEPGPALARYRLLVVPARTEVDDHLAGLLREHLAAGGAAIVLGDSWRGDWAPGVRDVGSTQWSVPYLLPTPAAAGRLDDFPYALYGGCRSVEVDATGTEVFATLGEPLFERSPEHFTSHGYTPLGRRTDRPVAWRTGRLGGLAFDAGTAFLEHGYWAQTALFSLVLDAVLPDRLLRCTAGDLLDLALTRLPAGRDHHTVVHVTPALAERAWGHRPVAWSEGVTLADLELTLRLDRPVTHARLVHTADRAHVQLATEGDLVTLRLDRLDGPELVVLG